MKKKCTISGQTFEYESKEDFLKIIKRFPNFTIGENFLIGNDFTAGNGFTAGYGFKAGKVNKFEVLKVFSCNGLYKYHCGVLISKEKIYIILGCHCRTTQEWEDDFWNNPLEFPNDNSEKSKARVMAYEMCKTFIKLNT